MQCSASADRFLRVARVTGRKDKQSPAKCDVVPCYTSTLPVQWLRRVYYSAAPYRFFTLQQTQPSPAAPAPLQYLSRQRTRHRRIVRLRHVDAVPASSRQHRNTHLERCRHLLPARRRQLLRQAAQRLHQVTAVQAHGAAPARPHLVHHHAQAADEGQLGVALGQARGIACGVCNCR